jgi:PAT family acetyl-CoA transporter-like MFS transporter 1
MTDSNPQMHVHENLSEPIHPDPESDPTQSRAKDQDQPTSAPHPEAEYTKGCFQKHRGYKSSMLVLFILFLYRGLISGMVETITLITKSKGATMQDQAILSLSHYPWTLKIFIAVFFDAFFIRILGKCKSYILLCGTLKFIAVFTFAFYVNDMVDNLQIVGMAWFYFGLNMISALESIAVDAWLLTLLKEEYLPKGALADICGQLVGGFITMSIFGTLTSVNLLNRWVLVDNPLKEPLMTMRDSHFFVAAFSLISMTLIMMLVSEQEVTRASFCEVLKILPKFVTNKYIRNLLIFTCLKYWFITMYGATYINILIEKKFPYD